MLVSIYGAIVLGLLYALMALGVYITFRILDFPDLTVDGSFVTGGAICATMISHGYNPYLATLAGCAGGAAAGVCTGLLHTKGRINGLLAGILMMIALYSINIRIMGTPNVSLLNVDTVLSPLLDEKIGIYILVAGIGVLVLKLLLDAFLHTDLGLALRATGDNARMIRSFGANTDRTKIIGIGLSNGLVALSGALFAQHSAYIDVNTGVGMIVTGLASVIIGEAIFGMRRVWVATLAVIVGSIVYRVVYALALRIEWFEASDLKVITAAMVIVALIIPQIRRSMKQKSVARKRTLELAGQLGAASSAGKGGRA